MSTREDFEAWADANGWRLPLPGRTCVIIEMLRGAYQAGTSRQEAKIKALVDALEGVAAMARCGQLDGFIGEPWLNSVHQSLAAAKE